MQSWVCGSGTIRRAGTVQRDPACRAWAGVCVAARATGWTGQPPRDASIEDESGALEPLARYGEHDQVQRHQDQPADHFGSAIV